MKDTQQESDTADPTEPAEKGPGKAARKTAGKESPRSATTEFPVVAIPDERPEEEPAPDDDQPDPYLTRPDISLPSREKLAAQESEAEAGQESEPEEGPEAEAGPGAEAEAEAEAEPEAEPEREAEPEQEPEPGPAADAEPEPEPEPEPEQEPAGEAEEGPGGEVSEEPEPEAESGPGAEPEAEAAAGPEAGDSPEKPVPSANSSGQWTVSWNGPPAPSASPTVEEPLPVQQPPPPRPEAPAPAPQQPLQQAPPVPQPVRQPPPAFQPAQQPPSAYQPVREAPPAYPPRQEAPSAYQQAPAYQPVRETPPPQPRWEAAAPAPPRPSSRSTAPPLPTSPSSTPPPTAPAPSAPSSTAPPLPGEPRHRYPAPEKAKGRGRRRALIAVIAALVLVAGLVTGQLVRPAPDPSLDLTLAASRHTFAGSAPRLPLPVQGQSSVFVDGLGTMGSSGGSAPTPTASVAKVMTAYVFLRDHPLASGEPGPVYTVSPQAAAEVPARRRRDESLLGVTANQRLTQRKALEALMLISANDVAHELARWDAGGDQQFVQKMNDAARSLGMTGTTYTDPSGYDSGTVSTAADQVKLLRAAIGTGSFGEIVNNRAYVPDDGGQARPGGNILLGQYGVIGGKTGYTDAAGGNYVFAARKRVAGVATLIVGAVMGQHSTSAMAAVLTGQRLVVAAEGALTAARLAPAGARVAVVDDGLGGRTPLRATAPVTVVGWAGLTVPVGVTGDPPKRGAKDDRVGEVTAGAARVPLVLDTALGAPSLPHRLTRLG